MSELLNTIAVSIEQKLAALNAEREKDGLEPLAQANVVLLGQFALLLNPEINTKFPLANTVDIDALLKCDWSARSAIKSVFLDLGYVYDELSEEVWIPPHSKFVALHESSSLKLEALAPIYVLVSKAVKAPLKNRFLIQQALVLFGDELIKLIEVNGGEPSFFVR